MTDVSFPAAAIAGLISFLSPCVLPLAPPYLCYLAGTSLEQLVEEDEKRAIRDTIIVALLFVLGFSTVFVALGATALKALTRSSLTIEAARREEFPLEHDATGLATYHPSAILRAEGPRAQELRGMLVEDLRRAAKLSAARRK